MEILTWLRIINKYKLLHPVAMSRALIVFMSENFMLKRRLSNFTDDELSSKILEQRKKINCKTFFYLKGVLSARCLNLVINKNFCGERGEKCDGLDMKNGL